MRIAAVIGLCLFWLVGPTTHGAAAAAAAAAPLSGRDAPALENAGGTRRREDGAATTITETCSFDPGSPAAVTPNATCTPSLGAGTASLTATVSLTTSPLALDNVDVRAFGYAASDAAEAGRVTVAVAAMGMGPSGPVNPVRLAAGVQFAAAAGAAGADLVVLPEEFAGQDPEPSVEASAVTRALAAVAANFSMYVAFGVRVAALPNDTFYSDQGPLGYNTVVILDRNGSVVGQYRKQFPCCPPPMGGVGSDGYPGRSGTPVYDLPGVGRVAVLTCFDMNFAEVFHEAYTARADLVIWPSAYGGGLPLRALAALYKVVIVPNGWGDITDQTGRVASGLRQVQPNLFVATVDLDRTFVHMDFNDAKVARLLIDHVGDVEALEVDEYCSVAGNCFKQGGLIAQSNAFLLARTDAGYAKGMSVRQLLAKYEIEDLRSYQHRSRRVINQQRATGRDPTKTP
jgi:predicted amidohydrolase